MENRSLDDFLDGEKAASASEAGPESSTSAGSTNPDAADERDAGTDAAGKEEADTDGAGDGGTDPDAAARPGGEPDANGDREPNGNGEARGAGPEAARVDPGTVEPAATTYAAGAGECVACGASVGERWRGEAGLVCPACKEW